ncbi:MAG: glycosyltransferase family 39 protein, partial [Pseudomonadota bacterium]|nr:glycosyltransferase family 39 protein [Pseudomonadota bacterium]
PWTERLRSVPALLALLALWLSCTAGLRPLLVPDEGRYASVALEMLRHGDWLVPTLNGLPFFHKPPLFYWLDIAAMRLIGVNAFAARFAPFVGAWLMGTALLLALRRWHGLRTATLGLVVLATCPLFFVAAQYANHDMLVAGLITVAVLAFVRALEAVPNPQPNEPTNEARNEAPKPALRWIVAGWTACALALLAKGLIGVVLPLLVVGPWLLAQRRWRDVLRLLHPLGLAAFALVAGPWLVAMQLRFSGFFDYFIVEQHFRRYAQSNFNNVHPFWFFIVVLPALTLPWSGWLAAGSRRMFAMRGPLPGLYAWWIVAVVGFFSLPSSKLVGYVLPALTPWCALTAMAIAGSASRSGALRISVIAAVLICAGVPLGLAWKAPTSHRAAALALGARLEPGDRVAMVDEYLYDVPFYARLTQPVIVASDWAEPDLPRHDNWKKELFDAARFDPEQGRAVLWPIGRLAQIGCGAHAVWFVVKAGQNARLGAVPGIDKAYADTKTELWRAPGPSDCGR